MTHLLPDRRLQGDFFVADILDASPKDDTASMEHPLFALRAGDRRVRVYERNGYSVTVKPGVDGCATIHDKDLWIYLRTYGDALALGSQLRAGVRVAVIGGGFIGLELAASARKHGCPVTVIEALPRILMCGVPAEIAAVIHQAHVDNGATMLTGTGIANIADTGSAAVITLADGTMIDADVVVVGIGAMPNTQLAEQAGLAVDNGIAVDETLATSDSGIYAAGDCCSFPAGVYGGRRLRLESWRNAQEQGALAARNMMALPSRTRRCRGFGRINMTSDCRLLACRIRARQLCTARLAMARSSCSIWRRTGGLWRPVASGLPK